MKKELVDQELFDQINESDVQFPLFFKNKYDTCFTMYVDEEKFEQLSINKHNESFRGCILFGFNEQLKELKGDLRMWFYVIFRNQIQITQEEYEKVFNSIIEGRQEFFSGSTEQKYIERAPASNQEVKHKWKPVY